ncbi:MAG: flippase-like domain-containing protein [Anaerolineae bacterium]|nr:flippase-like domain-containing protein [Anaerolineae bacterium]
MKRNRVRGLLQVAISVALLAFILRQVHWAEVWAALRRMDGRWLIVAWLLFLAGVIVRARRWQGLLDALAVHRPLRELVTWYLVGGFFNIVLPTGFGGDVVRAAELAQDTGRPARAVNSVIVDRYLGIMVLLAMGLIAAPLRAGVASAATLAAMAALFGGGLLAGWALRRPWRSAWADRPGRLGTIAGRLAKLADAFAVYDRRALARGLVASFVFNVLQIGWNVALGWGLGLRLPLVAYLVFVPLTAVALLLPAFGGLGVRELTYVGLFGQIGVPAATAMALSLGVYIITVATGLLGGLVYLAGGMRRLLSAVP